MTELRLEEVIAELSRQAEDARAGPDLPEAFEAGMEECFASLATDLASLRKGVESGELTARQHFSFGHDQETAIATDTSGRLVTLARSATRRGISKVRHKVGPTLRATERRSIEAAGQFAEALATSGQVARDRARRLGGSGHVARQVAGRLARVSPAERARPQGGTGSRTSATSLGDGSWQLEDWAMGSLKAATAGPVLHTECGEGDFVRRLAANGHDASGADPAAAPATATMARAGAFESLGRTPRCSLAGLVLSGVTDCLSPAQARALVHLASSRLRGGGILVIVSAHPELGGDGDVIATDLSGLKALHPVTWCHLLGRYGFGQITVQEAVGAFYGVSAVRQGAGR
ncbi:MAG: hypothetical protein ACRD0Z_13615 [Acidimicrobiales bacterium]